MIQTVGLALATDLVPVEDQPKVVGLMYVALLVGMIVSALIFGWLLRDYTPGKLIQVVQGAAVVTVVLNLVALWKQEPRDRARAANPPPVESFSEAWSVFTARQGTMRLLIVIALGTMAYGMAEVLLEPYGGEALHMSVAMTTRLTAVLAGGSLLGFWFASHVLLRGGEPLNVATYGAAIGVPGFLAIATAAQSGGVLVFSLGVFACGVGAGLFGHGTLTATMRRAPRAQIGLALGVWGAVQASAAGIAIAAGGILRDVVLALPGGDTLNPATPYIPVFLLEALFLVVALCVIWRLQAVPSRNLGVKP